MAKPKIDFDNPVVGGQGGGFEAGPRLIISGKSRFRVFRRQLSKKEQEELEKQNLSEDELEARTNEILGEPKLVFTLEMKRLTDDGDVIMVGSGDDEHELVEVKNFGLGCTFSIPARPTAPTTTTRVTWVRTWTPRATRCTAKMRLRSRSTTRARSSSSRNRL
jgi:hypothetical protein